MTKGPTVKLPKLKFLKKAKSRGSSRSASPTATPTNPQDYSVTPEISTTQANSPTQAQIGLIESLIPYMIRRKAQREARKQRHGDGGSESQPSEVQEQTIEQQQFDEESKQEEDNCQGEDDQYQECLRMNSENCKLMYDVLMQCQNKFY